MLISHKSYPNITTVIHSYEYSTTVDNRVKWRQEAAVRYQAQEGPAGTSAGFDISQGTARAVKGPYAGHPYTTMVQWFHR